MISTQYTIDVKYKQNKKIAIVEFVQEIEDFGVQNAADNRRLVNSSNSVRTKRRCFYLTYEINGANTISSNNHIEE